MILLFSIYGLILNTLWCVKPYLFVPKETRVYHEVFKRQSASLDSELVPLRRNILEFQNDRVSLSLFLQALRNLQDKQEKDLYSYFQLAGKLAFYVALSRVWLISSLGIHGRPYIPWNTGPKTPGAYNTGYCLHNSVLFLPWHRPYLSVVENSLIAEAQGIAKGYKNYSTTYQEAANDLRIPYWDWAESPKLPDIATKPKVEIDTWNGVEFIENPLFQYKFYGGLDPNLFPPDAPDGWFSNFSTTVRGVNTKNRDEFSHLDRVNDSLQRSNIMANTWRVFVKSKSFNAFSTTLTPGLSLEGIHNNVHGSVGGRYGHMSFLAFSAFDPLFWLHHANIDRLFALWQAINPDAYLMPQEDLYGNFIILPHTMVDENTGLVPFWNQKAGEWWTSASSRSLSAFSYTYPELRGNQTPEQLKKNATGAINRLYNPGGIITRRFIKSNENNLAISSSTTREWSLAIRVSKFDLGGSRFKILIFMGGVPSNSEDLEKSSTFIDSVIIFPPPYNLTMKNLPQIITYSEVNLNDGLRRNGRNVEDVSSVINYLRTQLEWRVQRMDSSIVTMEQVPSLNITLQEEMMKIPVDSTQLPTYGEKAWHPEAFTS